MSLSKPGNERDTVGEFIILMGTANGREKLYRFLQYGTKFLKWREETQNAPKETLAVFDNVYRTLSMTRKLLRFFRWLAIFREIRAAWPANASQWNVEAVLNISSKAFLASYFLFDHCMYAIGTGMWTPPPTLNKTLNSCTEGSWCGEIVSSILLAVLKISQLSGLPQTPENSAKFWAFARAIVRNGVDLPVALHFMGQTGSTPHGYFGALGTISSAISLWEMWPTVFVPKTAATGTAVVAAK